MTRESHDSCVTRGPWRLWSLDSGLWTGDSEAAVESSEAQRLMFDSKRLTPPDLPGLSVILPGLGGCLGVWVVTTPKLFSQNTAGSLHCPSFFAVSSPFLASQLIS